MKYVGMQTQQRSNNLRSLLLLCLFPCLVVALVFLCCYAFAAFAHGNEVQSQGISTLAMSTSMFEGAVPFALGGVLLWFGIAYFANSSIIKKATSSHSLSRRENKRVYNLVENLCMANGMPMPKVNVIDDDSLNAFASGINKQSYTVTLSRGIIDKLDDAELEGVIAHELSHIRNRDVRLLIVSIVFVGIFAMVAQLGVRMISRSAFVSRRNDKGGGIILLLIVVIAAAIGYFFSSLMRFAISRKREYMADAGAAQMTRNPQALASALRKISGDPEIESITRDDVAQLFIEHPGRQAQGLFSKFGGLFATHPPIEKRIQVLEQF